LIATDTDALNDVYLRDLVTGQIELISVDSFGAHAPGGSIADAISADGRYVAFDSVANGLIPGDTSGDTDIFVRDRLTGTTIPISVSSAGIKGNGVSLDCAMAPDGRFVAFRSFSTNLVPGDTNGEFDVFVRDMLTGTTERISVGPGGAQAHGDSYVTSVSTGGRLVLFSSTAPDLVPGDVNNERDIFVRDRVLGTTTRISVDSFGVPSNGDSHAGYISADGRFATYVSIATNLVPGDTNGVPDVFVYELATGQTTRASVNSSGVQVNAWTTISGISPDGRFVALMSDATNLAHGDTGLRDLFVRDRWTGTTERVNTTASGGHPDQDSWNWGGTLSADARYVTYFTTAGNVVPGNPGANHYSVYVHDRGPASTFKVVCAGGATCPCGNSGAPGHGCDNSSATGGARLVASGASSTTNDTVQLSVSGETAGALTVVVQGDVLIAPAVFGDGLRCVGGSLKRLYLRSAPGGALSVPQAGDLPVSGMSALLGDTLLPGSNRVYQTYYRDSVLGFCAGETFNLSQAIVIAWGA
jgi:Tol biopolymer transport system component